MPEIISVSKVDLPYRPSQSELKEFARETFSETFDDVERLLESFDNAKIDSRNFCVPLEYFYSLKTFEEKNELYVENCLKFSIRAIEDCI
ncbi:MAG: type III polyketide synthase, partial [Ignavibacteria bacterium]